MQKIIGVTELQRRFRAIFDEVTKREIPYVLTRASHPEAVLLSYKEFLHLQQLQEQDSLARFDRLAERMAQQNQGFSESEVTADIEAARTEVNHEYASFSGHSNRSAVCLFADVSYSINESKMSAFHV